MAKKTRQIHIFLEESLLQRLEGEAMKNEVNFSEWCRTKLKGKPQLDRIEDKLDRALKKRGILKTN